jgi:hypothetical protein
MQKDLEQAYIPACAYCQRNKSATTKPIGPLHPLPVPDRHCDSVAIDFIGPLPPDNGFDCIVTFTNRLGSKIQIVPTTTSLNAEGLAELFFREWYCENGLLLEIVSDHDKLFLSQFWRMLHKLTGIKLKMSSSYHPQTDSASKRTNKTVIQCIQFAVERDQKGWANTLPKVRFNIMSTTNASTGYTPFQLRFGRLPRILPPLMPSDDKANEEPAARELIEQLRQWESSAQDNLLAAKIHQAFQANKDRQLKFPFRVGDRVVLLTLHRRREYKSGEQHQAAKFMPCYDGPYRILNTDKAHSTVTLDMPHKPNLFPIFHTSEIHPFQEKDDALFPQRALQPPAPVIINEQQEFFIEKIVDERRQGKRRQYLVRWRGKGPKGDEWLPASEVKDCKALDFWEAQASNKLPPEKLTITIPAR